VMTLYRADGLPPIERMRPPAMIADFAVRCVFGDDRVWRLQSHVIRPIFVGSDRRQSRSTRNGCDGTAHLDARGIRAPAVVSFPVRPASA
jgi:hypothetical protein